MEILIKTKKRILVYIIFCLIFSLSNEIIDFTKNKKILIYEIKINSRVFENYIYKINNDPFGLVKKALSNFDNFGPYYYEMENAIFFDQNFVFFNQYNHDGHLRASLRNYIKSDMKYKFQEFINKKNFDNNQKKIMLNNFNKNFKLSFLIETKSGLITNEIVIKTFAPRFFEEFFLSFIKDIKKHLRIKWYLEVNKIVFNNLKIKFMNKVHLGLTELANKNIILNSNINDTYKNLENLNFFESDELIVICKFLDSNYYEIKYLNKFPDNFLSDLEEIKKVEIEELFERQQIDFIEFIKKSENKFIDLYNVWTLLIIGIFLSITAEILYRKIVK